jgi:hypothetical protein
MDGSTFYFTIPMRGAVKALPSAGRRSGYFLLPVGGWSGRLKRWL